MLIILIINIVQYVCSHILLQFYDIRIILIFAI